MRLRVGRLRMFVCIVVVYGQKLISDESMRINWSSYLGKSLNAFVSEQRALGKTKEEILQQVRALYFYQGGHSFDNKIMNVISIGVSARFGESDVAKSSTKEGLRQLGKYVAECRSFADGTKFFYASPLMHLEKGKIYELTIVEVEKK